MRQVKNHYFKLLALAVLLVFISFIDYLYRNLFISSYHPFLSALVIFIAIALLLYLAYRMFLLPYKKILLNIDRLYNDFTKEIATILSDTPNPSGDSRLQNLKHLISYYRSANMQQSELVHQLTNRNNILDQNNRFANAIVQITSEILHSRDINSILQLILNKAVEIIPNAQKGSILLYNKEHLEYKAMYGYHIEALQDFKFEFNEIFQYNAENLYDPIIIPDVEQFNKDLKKDKFEVLKETRSFELKSCMSCAISVDNEFYGIINIDNVDSNYAFIEEHKPIIKYFAEQIGVALKNAQLLERILYLSRYDSLTEICNRAFFEEQLEKLHEEAQKNNTKYTLAIMDLNDLKRINDHYGHDAGDRLIVSFINHIKNHEKLPHIFGRIGGDEFGMVYYNESASYVKEVIADIRSCFSAAPFQYNGQELMTISFGCGTATYPEDGLDVSTLFKSADLLMYADKKSFKELHSIQ